MKNCFLVLLLSVFCGGFLCQKISDGKLLIGLGVSSSGYTKSFEVIDLDDPSTECETFEDFPVPRESAMPFLGVGEEPIVCGGFGNGTAKRDCLALKNGKWTQISSMNTNRRFSSITPVRKDVYVAAGGEEKRADILNSLEFFDQTTWINKTNLNRQFSRHCAVLLKETTLMIIGGMMDEEEFSRKTFFLDLKDNSLTDGPLLLEGRQLHKCARINLGKVRDVVVVGGRNKFGVLSSVEVYDPDSNQFIPGPKLPEPICYASMIEYRYGVLLIGGQNKTSTKSTIYRLKRTGVGSEWDLLSESLKIARRHPVALFIPNQLTSCKRPTPVASRWHLIFGGKETAELYDFQTNSGCVLPENPPYLMRRPSGVLFGGNTPTACYQYDCMSFSRNKRTWSILPKLENPVTGEGSVYIYREGWTIFKKLNHPRENWAHLLEGLSTTYTWESGESVKGQAHDYQECVLQFNNTLTVFLGIRHSHQIKDGSKYRRGIKIYDWSRKQYITQKSEFIQPRQYSACAIIKSENGTKYAAVIGGIEANSIEAWNPDSGYVHTISDHLFGRNCYDGCYSADINAVSVNDGSELILFGGRKPKSDKGTKAIWLYNLKADQWSNIGNMSTDRWGHVVFPVYGIDCKNLTLL